MVKGVVLLYLKGKDFLICSPVRVLRLNLLIEKTLQLIAAFNVS